MKKIALIVLSAAILLAAPSCKKQDCKVTRHVVTEEYVYADPCDQPVVAEEANAPAEEEVKIPRLGKCKAKGLVKDVLAQAKVINAPRVIPVEVGYYECNDLEYRKLLYRAEVNELVDVEYSEIKDTIACGHPTYWVNVALTPKGKALIVEDDDPIFPEDTITDYSVVSPSSGQNKYGEYTFDPNVDADVVTLIQDFYKAYADNKNVAIYNYGTSDLVLAQERILKAIELGVRKNVSYPFVCKATDAANINITAIYKWTSYDDLYVAMINGAGFCFVVKEEGGVKKIDDIACRLYDKAKSVGCYTINATDMTDNCLAIYNPKNTWRYFALKITARELHDAQKALDAIPANPRRYEPVAPSVANTPETPLLFDPYNPNLMPGIQLAEHNDPLPYKVAKDNEYAVTFNLLAFDKKFAKMGKIKDVKCATVPTKKAEITLKTVKVSPLGRICYNEKEGAKETFVAYFQYFDEEWICVGVHEKQPFPAVDCSAVNPRLGFVKDAEVTPNLSEQLGDQLDCSCQ